MLTKAVSGSWMAAESMKATEEGINGTVEWLYTSTNVITVWK